jgi:hypothetical protein
MAMFKRLTKAGEEGDEIDVNMDTVSCRCSTIECSLNSPSSAAAWAGRRVTRLPSSGIRAR